MKNETYGKTIVRGVVTGFLVLIFSVSLLISLLAAALTAYLSEDYVIRAAQSASYCTVVRETIEERFSNLYLTSGLSPQVGEAFLQEDVTDEIILTPLRQMVRDEAVEIPTERLKSAFVARVEDYGSSLRESGEMDVSEEEWGVMREGFSEMADIFLEEALKVIRYRGFLLKLSPVFAIAKKLLPILFYSGAFFALASFFVLLLIWKKRIALPLYIAFSSAGVVLLVPGILYRSLNLEARLALEAVQLKNLFLGLAENVCQTLTLFGWILLGLGILCGAAALLLFLLIKEGKTEGRTQNAEVTEEIQKKDAPLPDEEKGEDEERKKENDPILSDEKTED